ncbi:MAG TPA: MerR family transcriptional regulator [Acidimicrobiales bacterium]|nr:MerR family transcriptional regulator [Acidimicrobiales bacterium]
MGALTIGRLAEAAGVHVETVRYYERRGLIEPPPRSPSGYRQYSADDLWRLQFIARGKQLGFTLSEIAEVLGDASRTTEAVRDAAEAKIAVVDERLAELARTRCRLQQLADLCSHGDAADCVALRVAAG